MKKHIALSIPQPCHEKWEQFTKTKNSGFCNSCSKAVVDFTAMSDFEIIDFLQKNKGHACGRFRPNQLERPIYLTPVTVKPGLNLLKAGVLASILFLLNKPAHAQHVNMKPATEAIVQNKSLDEKRNEQQIDFTIKGVVIAKDDHSPLPGVNVWLRGSVIGTVTDIDGKFEFPQKLAAGDQLVFSFIGMMSTEYKVRDQTNAIIEIKMDMDFEIMGEVSIKGVYSEPPNGWRKAWMNVKNLF